jgi:hypothetical protein
MEQRVTFDEARTILRNDVLAEASTDYYSDEDLLGFLARSARELAMAFGFPTGVDTVSLTTDDASFSLPADAANMDLNEVSYDGFSLTLAPYRTILQYVDQTSVGQPRYYNFDPKRGDLTVYIAPKAPRDASVRFEYVKEYDTSSVVAGDSVWDGLFPEYHELVIYRAGVKAFDASLENDRAGYWVQKEQAKSQEFAAFLNKAPLERLMGEGANES